MTKDVEVGDEFTGKVVKTTTFGAFIELTKGIDGLLHITNVRPGERVDAVEDVLNRGDEIDVRVVEVDKERGRIGLRLRRRSGHRRQDRRGAGARRHRRQGRRRPSGGGGGRGRGGVTAADVAVEQRRRRAPTAATRR